MLSVRYRESMWHRRPFAGPSDHTAGAPFLSVAPPFAHDAYVYVHNTRGLLSPGERTDSTSPYLSLFRLSFCLSLWSVSHGVGCYRQHNQGFIHVCVSANTILRPDSYCAPCVWVDGTRRDASRSLFFSHKRDANPESRRIVYVGLRITYVCRPSCVVFAR